MVDPWSRRDVFGQVLAAGIAVHLPAGNVPGSGSPSKASSVPENIVGLRLFTDAGQVNLPDDCQLVWTSGYSRLGHGGACYQRDASVNISYVRAHSRTAFTDSQGKGFRLVEQDLDVRQTGALGDGTTDDTTAFQEALDFVEASGGGMVTVPTGEYHITAPLQLPPRVAMRGTGPASILRVTGCNGLIINASDEIGPRGISDFALQGRGCENFTAIVIDVEDSRRAQGLVFERLYLSFFGTGLRSRGLWHSTFRTITMNQIWGGGVFSGRNVKILIDDCRLTHASLLRGTGEAVGFTVGDEKHTSRPEDVQISNTIIYGFEKGIVWRTALFGGVTNCDLDACTRAGLELVTADGGFNFSNNWVNIISPSGLGIDCTALGYDPKTTNVLLSNNNINSTSKSPALAGVRVGSRQSGISIHSNSVSGIWSNSVHIDGAHRVSVANNKVDGKIAIERSNDVSLSYNFAGGGLRLTDNLRLDVGVGLGPQSPKITGTVTIPAGKSLQTATFQSLGLSDLPEGKYRTLLILNSDSSKEEVSTSGTVTRTGISITTDRSLSRVHSVSFRIEVY